MQVMSRPPQSVHAGSILFTANTMFVLVNPHLILREMGIERNHVLAGDWSSPDDGVLPSLLHETPRFIREAGRFSVGTTYMVVKHYVVA
jgi:hypothetical protein